MEIKPLRFIVNENASITGQGKNGKSYRKQRVLVHHGDEVTSLEYMLDTNEPFLTPGEYRLSPDAVYLGTSTREYNGRTYAEPQLRVAPRFVRLAAAPAAKAA